MRKCSWPLGNGNTLDFTIYTHEVDWNKVPGLYVFAYMINDTQWHAVYVGQADDFSSRIPDHEKWSSAVRLGATHVHALAVPLAANRDTWERRLIAELQPNLNVQHRHLEYPSLYNHA